MELQRITYCCVLDPTVSVVTQLYDGRTADGGRRPDQDAGRHHDNQTGGHFGNNHRLQNLGTDSECDQSRPGTEPMTPEQIYTRMFQVQQVWGVSQYTARHCDKKKGSVKVDTRGRISLIVNANMHRLFEDDCGVEK
jgi:hypothetical protein